MIVYLKRIFLIKVRFLIRENITKERDEMKVFFFFLREDEMKVVVSTICKKELMSKL